MYFFDAQRLAGDAVHFIKKRHDFRAQHNRGHPNAADGVRRNDPVCPSFFQEVFIFIFADAGDNKQFRVQRTGAQRDEHVIFVFGQRGNQAIRLLNPRPYQRVIPRGVAFQTEHVFLLRHFFYRFFVMLNHDERRVHAVEFLGNAQPDPA